MLSIATISLDIEKIRKQVPILNQQVNGHDLVYFDNAATTQKPKQVIDALMHYYSHDNANIHRGIHTLAERATKAFEATRETAKRFINASSTEEIIFVKGVTEGINLVASSFGKAFINEGDEIIISGLEHHSNIVPWQIVCEERRAKLKVIPVLDNGEIDFDAFTKLLSKKTKLVAINHASNSLGTINPVEEIIEKAHAVGACVLLDGAQAAAHLQIDVQKLDCDFYCISGHKMYGPTGSGFLYGKKSRLEKMPPYQAGGEMISNVSFAKTTYNDLPYKFEAGTPNIADTIALKSAMDFINEIGKPSLAAHENELLRYATEKISGVNKVRLVGTAKKKVSVVSFVMEGIHHFDIGQMLDSYGIAVRTGHHCTQPLMERFGIEGTVRASFAVYNTMEEIDKLVGGLEKVVKVLGK
jgi:cysteine desulfurase / selenocysteine lyase